MHLYECGKEPDIIDLITFCKKDKVSRDGRSFFILVFSDDEFISGYPEDQITADYGGDEKYLKHIKAIYTYNQINGYSKLKYYEFNAWESPAQEIDI